MKPNRAKQLMIEAFVAVMLIAGVGLTTAEAQNRVVYRPSRVIVYRTHSPFWYRRYDPFWSPYWGTYTYVDPITAQKEQGYSDGRSRGKKDAKKGLANAPESHDHYNDSNSLAYREAFLKGYADGYREEVNKVG